MRVNIFGVGRSGTKAVQLYIAFLMAEKYGEVHLNYEPYLWKNRNGVLSQEGIKHHVNTPQFVSSTKELSKKHVSYLGNLCPSSIASVSKFIRGNGRISAINQIINPDFTIIIFRDAYSVLKSVTPLDWDFYSIGSRYAPSCYKSYWSQIQKKFEQLNNKFSKKKFELHKEDPIFKNLIYWYVMNKVAMQYFLESNKNSNFLISFENMSELQKIAQKMGFGNAAIYHPSNPIFEGSLIQSSNTIINKPVTTDYHRKLINFSLIKKAEKVGNLIQINPLKENSSINSILHDKKKIRIEIKKNEIIDILNEEIKADLNQIMFSK